jgi:hypothetical protein
VETCKLVTIPPNLPKGHYPPHHILEHDYPPHHTLEHDYPPASHTRTRLPPASHTRTRLPPHHTLEHDYPPHHTLEHDYPRITHSNTKVTAPTMNIKNLALTKHALRPERALSAARAQRWRLVASPKVALGLKCRCWSRVESCEDRSLFHSGE